MIAAEIKIHEEPTTYNYTSQNITPYSLMTGYQKEQYEKQYEETLKEAKAKYTIGDKVKLSSNNNVINVIGFVEHPKDVIIYSGDMCVIYGQFEHSPQSNTNLRYALKEFDYSTRVPAEVKQLPLISGDTNEISH